MPFISEVCRVSFDTVYLGNFGYIGLAIALFLFHLRLSHIVDKTTKEYLKNPNSVDMED